MIRHLLRTALAVIFLVTSTALGPARAVAAELSDYLWQSRPLLVFSPTDNDPRLVDMMGRIEATRCDFAERDMVLGMIVTEGAGTLDGQTVDASQAQRLQTQFGVDANSFSVVLIGKDGGEKLRVNSVPDMPAIYAVIDGMPMRGREMSTDLC
ncbi:MAG: DUF4174 domain-containing protein [Mycobacterium sp.]